MSGLSRRSLLRAGTVATLAIDRDTCRLRVFGPAARAIDRAGRTQPLVTPYHDNGYFFDAVVRDPVTVV